MVGRRGCKGSSSDTAKSSSNNYYITSSSSTFTRPARSMRLITLLDARATIVGDCAAWVDWS